MNKRDQLKKILDSPASHSELDMEMIRALYAQELEEPPIVVKGPSPEIIELQEKYKKLEDMIRETDMEIRAALLQWVSLYNRRYNLGKRRESRKGGGLDLDQFFVEQDPADLR